MLTYDNSRPKRKGFCNRRRQTGRLGVRYPFYTRGGRLTPRGFVTQRCKQWRAVPVFLLRSNSVVPVTSRHAETGR